MNTRSLCDGFLRSAERFPERPALSIQNDCLSFSELESLASRIGHSLAEKRGEELEPLTGVFGHRSFAAFAGVLGALFVGDGYVPLNPSFPPDRTLAMLERAQLNRFVVESASLDAFLDIVSEVKQSLLIVVPDADELDVESHHRLVTAQDLDKPVSSPIRDVPHDALAYLLFTSGSTGQPKGVMVTQANVNQFVQVMADRYDVTEQDRFSQTFDLTFDLSAFDMFVAWERGACVCCPTQGQKLLPAKYITSQEITIWFSVPSTAIMMKKLKMLKPDQYPKLRYSLFCGEALPLEVAEAFQAAASSSVVENLYGPTELTIACTLYRYDSQRASTESELGVVPIGEPYPEMDVFIADENLHPVAEGEAGELLMTGPQLSRGYWEDPEKTAAAFVVPPGQSRIFYRTGDRVVKRSADAPMLYLGRMDNQIKVQGYRVELGEIESALRDAAQVDTAIAAGYPPGVNGAESVVAFIGPSEHAHQNIQNILRDRLPSYMQPSRIITVDEFPLNANGKVDRKALKDRYLMENQG